MRRIIRFVTCIVLLSATTGTTLAVQLNNGAQFEAAAVKPVPASTPRRGRLQAVAILTPPGRLNVANATLNELIAGAYGLTKFQLVGGPGWMDTTRFTVEATAPSSANREQRLVMLQNLLGERFKLRVHKELKEIAVYALEVAQKRPALRPLTDKELACWTGCVDALKPIPTNHLRMTTLPSLISYLMRAGADRPIVDKTALTGNFAIDIDIEKVMEAAAQAGERPPSNSSIYDATVLIIEDTLGLKVAPAKAQLNVVVIDHVEPM